MKQFIKINDVRLRINTVKKYEPMGTNDIGVFFNTSRYKLEFERFQLPSQRLRDDLITLLDELLCVESNIPKNE